MLTGSGFLHRKEGSLFGRFDLLCAANFASSSAISFPEMPLWPGLHTNMTLHLCFSLKSFQSMLLSVSLTCPLPFLYHLMYVHLLI